MKRPKQRAAMPEPDARAIADAFIAAELGFLPACDGSAYDSSPASWSFLYRIPLEPGVAHDPSHWIVKVDVETRTGAFFPVI